jgi:hypothetical protein
VVDGDIAKSAVGGLEAKGCTAASALGSAGACVGAAGAAVEGAFDTRGRGTALTPGSLTYRLSSGSNFFSTGDAAAEPDAVARSGASARAGSRSPSDGP